MRRITSSKVAFSFLVVMLGSLSYLRAEHLVTFTRGQSIVVQSVEKRGNWYYFVLEGGGEMGVPAQRVARIEEYEAPPAPAVPEAALAAAAPASAPVATPGQPSVPANAALAPPSAPSASPEGSNQNPDSGANTMSPGQEDWRYRVKMTGGPRRMQADGPGGGMRRIGQGNRQGGGQGGYFNQAGAQGGRRPPYYQQQQQQQHQNDPPQQ